MKLGGFEKKKRPALSRCPDDSLIESNPLRDVLGSEFSEEGELGEWLNFLLGLSQSHPIPCLYLGIFG